MFENFRTRAAAFIRGVSARVAPGAKRGQRRFDAAVVDRLTASWLATSAAIDTELRGQLDLLRQRSRDLFKNNEYAVKFGRMVKNNVVGAEGFNFQARVTDPNGAPDTLANRAIEAAWYRWQRMGNCEVTGQRSFVEVCRSLVMALARDGEFLVRRVQGPGAGPFYFQLQVLDVARLDTTYNRAASGEGNAIIMGVEQNSYGKPVAYHIWSAAAGLHVSRTRERVPAGEIYHRFIPLEDGQTRGVPWMHAAMRRLNDLNGYREAAVIAARIGASKMGFFTTPDGQPADGEKDGDGNFIQQVSPGEIGMAPVGTKFESFNPDYPHQQFDAFCKAALRGISSAIGVSYNGLANDLEGVNFSSIRAGVLDEREEWMGIQGFFVSSFLTPIFEEWLTGALAWGLIRLPNGTALPLLKFDKFSAHVWQGRRWAWVDPLKDINASVVAIENRLASPQQICAQSGRDIEDVLDDIAAFQALAAAKGVSLGVSLGVNAAGAAKANATAQAVEAAEADDGK